MKRSSSLLPCVGRARTLRSLAATPSHSLRQAGAGGSGGGGAGAGTSSDPWAASESSPAHDEVRCPPAPPPPLRCAPLCAAPSHAALALVAVAGAST